MPSTDRKLELTAKASMAQPVPQPAVCSNGSITYKHIILLKLFLFLRPFETKVSIRSS